MINNNFLTHIHAKDPIYPLSDEPKVVVAWAIGCTSVQLAHVNSICRAGQATNIFPIILDGNMYNDMWKLPIKSHYYLLDTASTDI
jgi:hypothetical protein